VILVQSLLFLYRNIVALLGGAVDVSELDVIPRPHHNPGQDFKLGSGPILVAPDAARAQIETSRLVPPVALRLFLITRPPRLSHHCTHRASS
jgi:hypothetical protein